MPTIVSQIETKEKEVNACEERLDTIERTIRLKTLTDIQRQTFKEEEKQLKKKLKEQEKELSSLRKENGKNTVVSFAILAVVLLIYYTFWTS